MRHEGSASLQMVAGVAESQPTPDQPDIPALLSSLGLVNPPVVIVVVQQVQPQQDEE